MSEKILTPGVCLLLTLENRPGFGVFPTLPEDKGKYEVASLGSLQKEGSASSNGKVMHGVLGGGVEKGESPDNALRREVLGELYDLATMVGGDLRLVLDCVKMSNIRTKLSQMRVSQSMHGIHRADFEIHIAKLNIGEEEENILRNNAQMEWSDEVGLMRPYVSLINEARMWDNDAHE